MKKIFKVLGIISIVAVIGFSFFACGDDSGGGGTGGNTGGNGTGGNTDGNTGGNTGGNGTGGGSTIAVTDVSLNKTSLSLAVGGSETLTATVAPSNATNKAVTWSTSDATKATVANGVVTAVAAGSATITVTTADGNKTATCSVTVTGGGDGGTVSIEMVSIPAGTFMMGSPTTEPNRWDDETQHSVTLSAFSMSKYQVTQAQWVAVMGTGEDRTTTSYGKGNNYPIYSVNWYDAIVFCNKLSIKEGLNPVYSIGGKTNPAEWGAIPTSNDATWNAAVMDKSKNGYRLPTEAEWEYACRGSYPNKATETNTKPFGIGDGTKMISGLANFDVTYPYDLNHSPAGHYNDTSATGYVDKTTAVGSYTANNYGLYDMHGNVWEWCWDWYKADITADNTNPTGAVTGSDRVGRGGYWGSGGRYLRSASRSDSNPYCRGSGIGFRLVRS